MFNIWNKITDFLKKHPWLGEIFVFVVMLALYLPLQQSNAFADPDAFYHIKMAELIAAHGPIRNFIWMPFTTLANSFADQHFLYHLALIPFIKILGPLSGMKMATATLAAFAIAALAWSMRKMGIRYAWFFALAAGTMNALAFRIGLSKASAPGVALLMIGLALAARRRTWPLAAVAFIYVWTHGSWPALVGLGTVVILVMSFGKGDANNVIANPSLSRVKQSHENITTAPMFTRLLRRLRPPRNDGFKSLIGLWSGALLGVIINPFFPYQPMRLASDLPLVCLLAIVALIVFPIVVSRKGDKNHKTQVRIAIALSVCAGAFLVLTLRSQRHVEYFVPLAVAAVASWISEIRFAGAIAFLKKNYVAVIFVAAGSLAMLLSFAGTGLARAKEQGQDEESAKRHAAAVLLG